MAVVLVERAIGLTEQLNRRVRSVLPVEATDGAYPLAPIPLPAMAVETAVATMDNVPPSAPEQSEAKAVSRRSHTRNPGATEAAMRLVACLA